MTMLILVTIIKLAMSLFVYNYDVLMLQKGVIKF